LPLAKFNTVVHIPEHDLFICLLCNFVQYKKMTVVKNIFL